MSDEAAEEKPKEPAAPKAKASKIVLVLLVLNLGASGFAAFQGMQAAAAQAHAQAGHKEAEAPKHEVGPVVAVDPFIVNLNEPEAARYLKTTFELEVSGPDVAHELEKRKRPVRDEVLRYLSSLSVADTQGEAGKAKIQKEVVERIDKELGGGKIRRLFFVDFMVQ